MVKQSLQTDNNSDNTLNANESLPKSFYIPIGKAKSKRLVPLAFTIPDNIKPVVINGYIISWTKTAIELFSKIKPKKKKLPYVYLRGLIEVCLPQISRIDFSMGLSNLSPKYGNHSFAYLEGGEEQKIKEGLYPLLDNWITNRLIPYAEKEEVDSETCDRLRNLYAERKLVSIKPIQSQILPWSQHGNGSAKSNDFYSFFVLVDYIARQISGREIFQGCGKVKRVISNKGGISSGSVELITEPIQLEDKGLFSLFIRLEVVTLPSFSQPLLTVDVKKRRWLKSLANTNYDRKNINGLIFSEDFSDRAFSYTISHKIIKQDKETKKKIREWKTDDSFEVLRRELKLPTIPLNGCQIANGEASTDKCKVLLTYREGIQQDKEKHGIKTGVPPLDKLEAFDKITEILKPLGLEPFKCPKVSFKRSESHKIDDTSSRTINAPTVLTAILQLFKTGSFVEFDSQYLEKLEESEVNQLLKQHLEIDLSNLSDGRRKFKLDPNKKIQKTELNAQIEANQHTLQRLYPDRDRQPRLIVFYEQELKIDLKLLEAIIRIFWGDNLEIVLNSLPEKTHGAKKTFEDSHLKMKERAEKRREIWKPIAKQIAEKERPTFCLIMARKFYPAPDDPVNKPSTRKALTEIGRSCVQFILPPERRGKDNRIDITDFIQRTQSSMKDLLWAHIGRIDNVCENVDKWFSDAPDTKPKEIIGITIVRKNSGRSRKDIEKTFLPIAIRINVETGQCEMCHAYETSNQKIVSPWQKFSEALATISRVTPVCLSPEKNKRRTRFMEFAKQIISQSVQDNKQPLVMVDSSNCVRLWSWLSDSKIKASDIDIVGGEKMEKTWEGARIVRIRQELTPGIIDDKVKRLIKTREEDTRTKKELNKLYPDLEADEFLPTPSGSISDLFQLETTTKKMKSDRTQCITYLSIGRNTLHKNKRGASCYHQVHEEKLYKDDKNEKVLNQAELPMYTLEDRATYTDMWPTPNPLEIVVTLRQEGDNPDRIAALVESLRYGFGHYREGTALPAPLFFERVVRDYLSAFTLDDPNADNEDDEEDTE